MGRSGRVLRTRNARREHVSIAHHPFYGDQILRQLDIAASQTTAIEVISDVGKVMDDTAPVSLWALGEQMVISVWQQKVPSSHEPRVLTEKT